MRSYSTLLQCQCPVLRKSLFGWHILLIVWVTAIGPNPVCHAQLSPNSYSVFFLTINNGLSQGTNRYMLQGSRGYMLIGSQDGIKRYNGSECFHFPDSCFYENCKPLKQVNGIVEDINGDIWMVSRHGLYKYQQSRNTFKRYVVSQKKDVLGNIITLNQPACT